MDKKYFTNTIHSWSPGILFYNPSPHFWNWGKNGLIHSQSGL